MKYKKLLSFIFVSSLLVFWGCGDDDSSQVGSQAASTTAIYAFQTDVTFRPEDLILEASNLANICRDALSSYSPAVSCTHFYPFLGKSSTNGIKNFISANNLNANVSVKLIDGTTVVASSLQNLINNGPAVIGGGSWTGWPDARWFSGVESDGSAGGNCSDYSDNNTNFFINIASNGLSFDWKADADSCNYYDDYRYVCLCN